MIQGNHVLHHRFGVCHQQGVRFETRPVLPDVPVVGPFFAKYCSLLQVLGRCPPFPYDRRNSQHPQGLPRGGGSVSRPDRKT
jgi:hypothetical protein